MKTVLLMDGPKAGEWATVDDWACALEFPLLRDAPPWTAFRDPDPGDRRIRTVTYRMGSRVGHVEVWSSRPSCEPARFTEASLTAIVGYHAGLGHPVSLPMGVLPWTDWREIRRWAEAHGFYDRDDLDRYTFIPNPERWRTP